MMRLAWRLRLQWEAMKSNKEKQTTVGIGSILYTVVVCKLYNNDVDKVYYM